MKFDMYLRGGSVSKMGGANHRFGGSIINSGSLIT